MEQLLRGWNWVSVDWLYGWMIKTQPINNRCVRLNGNDGDCLDCPAAYRRGDTIIWLVDGLKRALVSDGAFRVEVEKHEKEEGFERLRKYVLSHPAGEATLLSDGKPVNEEDLAPFQPVDVLIGKQRIRVVMDNQRPYITDGRHRVCAAYQFGVADLPIWIEEL